MPEPLLCVTVMAATMDELRAKRDAVTGADLIELRLDTVRDPDVAAALANRSRPVVVACHPRWEGGSFDGSEEERKRILAEAIALGAEYVDVEWRAHFDDLIARTGGRGIVLSAHDFDGVPVDLQSQVEAMYATGGQVVKVAVQAKRLSDCLPLLRLPRPANSHQSSIAIAMGPQGLATRVLASRFGSKWTYAGSVHDVGQLTAETLLDQYRFKAITNSTAVYGIVGGSIDHSVSPAIHNAAFKASRLDAVYLPFPTGDADDFLTFGRAFGISGASVTIPHKVTLFDRVDEVYPVARRIGAINTIHVADGRWVGANTDANGFLAPLEGRLSLTGLRAAVLGAGGAARAVTVALASAGAIVRLHARNRSQAEALAVLAPVEIGGWPPEPGSWDLLVNCTPIGMYPHGDATPVPADQLTGRYVYDLIYNPMFTRLLREATAAGCQTMGGLEMIVGQAHDQFEAWTGTKPAKGVMREAALKRLAEFVSHEDHVIR